MARHLQLTDAERVDSQLRPRTHIDGRGFALELEQVLLTL
jgi:hypothetical protein